LRLFAFICGILLVCFPIAFIVTILLSPLWSWIEATYGIESIGHSGPSDWCFYLVYSVIAAIALIVLFWVRRSYRRA
jgi:uncharacterized BrkB/YihY/UPF0761 family membrane protein